MARPLRIEYPGAVYHLTSRGNRQEAIYLCNEDREAFLDILTKTVQRYNWICHGYCLMDNHYHLLIETLDANLSLGMRQLNGIYTQHSNRKHNKVGHVFQGRFKSILVEKETHLLELCRYIVLNPVRAGMVTYPKQWQWSSYAPTSTGKYVPSFLSLDWIWSHFSQHKGQARQLYIDFVDQGCKSPSSPWKKLIGQALFGSESFVEKMQIYLVDNISTSEIPKTQRYAGRPPLPSLLPKDIQTDKSKRNTAIAKAHLEYGYTLKQIAGRIGIHYTTVSKVISAHNKN